jgi:hypothetical protein
METTPTSSVTELSNATPPEQHQHKKLWISRHSLWAFAEVCLLSAVIDVVDYRAALFGLPPPRVGKILLFILSMACLMWMRTDARLWGRPFSSGGLFAAFVFQPIALPAYIVWTRRWWGLFVIVVSVLAVLAAGFAGEAIYRLAIGLPIVVM